MSLNEISPLALYVPLVAVLAWYGVLAADVRAAHDLSDAEEKVRRLHRLRHVIRRNRNLGRWLIAIIWAYFIVLAVDPGAGTSTGLALFWLVHLFLLGWLTRSISQWMTRAAHEIE